MNSDKPILGIIGGGQLGSMLAIAAKKLDLKTVVYCDDPNAPARNFCNNFFAAEYSDKKKIFEFVNLVNFAPTLSKCNLATSSSRIFGKT